MTTKQTVLNYYSAIHAENWQDYISDKLAYGFNSAEQNLGKQDYLQGAGNFFNSTTNVELAHLVVEGDKAAVIARYTAKSPRRSHPDFRGSGISHSARRQNYCLQHLS